MSDSRWSVLLRLDPHHHLAVLRRRRNHIAIARRKPRPPQPTVKSCVDDAIKDLEAMGLIKKNGKFRPDRNGVLQPVYVAIESVPDEELTPAERLIKLANKEGRFQIPEDKETSQ